MSANRLTRHFSLFLETEKTTVEFPARRSVRARRLHFPFSTSYLLFLLESQLCAPARAPRSPITVRRSLPVPGRSWQARASAAHRPTKPLFNCADLFREDLRKTSKAFRASSGVQQLLVCRIVGTHQYRSFNHPSFVLPHSRYRRILRAPVCDCSNSKPEPRASLSLRDETRSKAASLGAKATFGSRASALVAESTNASP